MNFANRVRQYMQAQGGGLNRLGGEPREPRANNYPAMLIPQTKVNKNFWGQGGDPFRMKPGKAVTYQDAPGGPNPDFWAPHAIGSGPPNNSGIVDVNAGDYGRSRLTDFLDPRSASYWNAVSARNPWMNANWFGGPPTQFTPPSWTPGYAQGPTMNPSFFDPQGFPYAEPVTGDVNTGGGSHHVPAKHNT